MEEIMTMVMMKIRCQESPSNTLSWKLYENPFYTSSTLQQESKLPIDHLPHTQIIHKLHLPVSKRKLADWNLNFIKTPVMESELEKAKAQISKLKVEIECERKARRKLESLNKSITKELSEEKKGREALGQVCEELASEVSFYKDEMNRLKQEIQEERKMLRVAEVIREERVQMKLSEAKILMEEKFSQFGDESTLNMKGNEEKVVQKCNQSFSFGGKFRFLLGENNNPVIGVRNMDTNMMIRSENPHIKRGIKGFVEFPKVVRGVSCRNGKRNLDKKMECQKAQLKTLLKERGPIRINGLVAS